MSRRRAFTLFDLIVLAAGGALGLGILVPYVGKIRYRAATAQSQNNMKQIVLACHNYHDVNGMLPPGVDELGYSVSARLLPYLEQQNVFQLINFTKDVDAKENAEARKLIIKTFLAPGDPIVSVSADWGATNYIFLAGSKSNLADNDGIFYRDSKVKLIDVTDGTSNTILCGETLKGDSGMKAMDVRRQHVQYKKDALAGLAETSGVRDFQDDKHIAADRGASWMDGRFLQGTFTASRTLNDSRPDVNCGGLGGLSGLRSLSGTVNVGYADGSVRPMNEKVTLDIWKALATRSGGEVVPDF